MNDKQKIFLIVGVMAFAFWLLFPLSLSLGRGTVGLDDFFDRNEKWWKHWYQILSFVISCGCALGFFLFKDKEETNELIESEYSKLK
tara:strand:- start:279 stop:539 length:261 start_codon:yes stop_codon:yes gene_type:complete